MAQDESGLILFVAAIQQAVVFFVTERSLLSMSLFS